MCPLPRSPLLWRALRRVRRRCCWSRSRGRTVRAMLGLPVRIPALLGVNAHRVRIGLRVMRSMRSANAICDLASLQKVVLRRPSGLHGRARKMPATLVLSESSRPTRTSLLAKSAPRAQIGRLAMRVPHARIDLRARIDPLARRERRENAAHVRSGRLVKTEPRDSGRPDLTPRANQRAVPR